MTMSRPDLPDPADRSSPTLLIVSLVTVLAGVAGVVAVAITDAGWAVLVTFAVLLVGLALVARTMLQQLGEDGDGH
jgi:hypothetical protein